MRRNNTQNQWIVVMTVISLLMLSSVLTATEPEKKSSLTDEQKKSAVQGMYSSYKKDFPDVSDISAADARMLSAKGEILFIDVRLPEEQAVSMIPNAITEKTFLNDPSIIDGKTAVAYCTIGYRSGVLSKKMALKGIPILNLAGGILAWALDGGPLVDTNGDTKRLHVYGKKWNYAPNGYEAVTFGFFEKLVK